MLTILDLNFLAIASSVLLAAGVFIVAVGLRHRRRGTEPRCRKCEYELTGLSAARCPECGSDISAPIGVVKGHRVRRRRLLILGIALLVLGGGMPATAVALLAQGFNIYSRLPTFILLAEAAGRLGITSQYGIDELHRRLRLGQLSSPEIQQMTAIALAEQKRPVLRGRVSLKLLDTLATLRLSGNLSDTEWNQVLDEAIRPRAPSVMTDGDARRLQLPYEVRGPLNLRAECSIARVEIDGASTLTPGSALIHSRGGRGERIRLRLPDADRPQLLRLVVDWTLDEVTTPVPFQEVYRTQRSWRQEWQLTVDGAQIRDLKIGEREPPAP